MHLTRRGYALVALVVGAEVCAITFGARAINAVAAPVVIALVAAAVQVHRTDYPTAERDPVLPGFPGDTREVTVDVHGDGVASVTDRVPAGITADPSVVDADGTVAVEATLPTSFAYAIRLDDRGRHEFDAVEVRVSDVLGLVATDHELAAPTAVLVYPPVYQVAGRETLLREIVDHNAVERQEFESLREYVPGDPLRDVHWKSTAKDPAAMYVTEFVDRRIDDTVVLAASSDPAEGAADAMATAAASVAVMAIEADVGVELRAPTQAVPMGTGPDHRDRLLRALALTEGGRPDDLDATEVDVHVHADADGVTLQLGSRTHTLEELTVSRANPLASREVSV